MFLKRQETDIIERFVTLLNYKTGSDIQVGGYGGWVRIQFNDGNTTQSFKIKYMHGFGGGGAVTRGTIQHNRMSVNVEGADAMLRGSAKLTPNPVANFKVPATTPV